jgi:L-alanine-DL-glutamate epimerase-like enolase superfamily enzyme
MQTEDGIVSSVYNGDNREAGHEVIRLVHEELAPQVIGESIFQVERLWARMFATTHVIRRRRGLIMEAIASSSARAPSIPWSAIQSR